MKASELNELSNDELEQKAHDTRRELFNAKVKHATGQLENTSLLRNLRRDVARVETVLAQKREADK